MESKHVSNTENIFLSDLFGFHDQYETLFDDAAESWIGIEKVFNLPTVDLKDE